MTNLVTAQMISQKSTYIQVIKKALTKIMTKKILSRVRIAKNRSKFPLIVRQLRPLILILKK